MEEGQHWLGGGGGSDGGGGREGGRGVCVCVVVGRGGGGAGLGYLVGPHSCAAVEAGARLGGGWGGVGSSLHCKAS